VDGYFANAAIRAIVGCDGFVHHLTSSPPLESNQRSPSGSRLFQPKLAVLPNEAVALEGRPLAVGRVLNRDLESIRRHSDDLEFVSRVEAEGSFANCARGLHRFAHHNYVLYPICIKTWDT